MIVTFKAFLNERRQKTDGTFPLVLRITANRDKKELPLNIFLQAKEWDKNNNKIKPNHPNARLINQKISQTLNEIQEVVLKLEASRPVFTVLDVVNTFIKKNDGATTFFPYADQQISIMLQTGRVGNSIAYKNAISKLRKFTQNPTLRFEEVNYKLLNSFANSMLAGGIGVNTVALYMREIRAIYNRAIKEGVVEQKYYPFNNYKIKIAKTISRTLSVEDMRKIAGLELLPNTPIWHARNYFLLSFCLIGINFMDMFLLTHSSIQNNRIQYSRSKTKKLYTIYLHETTIGLLKPYLNQYTNSYYMLPVLTKGDSPVKAKKDIYKASKTTNKYLRRIATICGIKQEVTTYYARYSWANIARSLGYSKDIIAEALGHSYGNAVTGIYLDGYGNEILDKANEDVIAAAFNLAPTGKQKTKHLENPKP